MADLDSLQIEIKASSESAAGSIDRLAKALGKLNTSLENFGKESKYLQNFQNLTNHVKDFNSAIGSIDLDKITSLSKRLSSLASASKALSGLSALKNIKMPQTEAFSDKAVAKAKEIATQYGVKDKDAVNSLTKAVDNLYNSVGDDKAFLSAKQNISDLIKQFSQFESAAKQGGLANIVKEIQATALSLPQDWAKNVVMPYNLDEKKARALMGLKNTRNEKGYDVLSEATANHPEWGIDSTAEASVQLQKLLEILSRYVELGGRATATWEEASKTGAGSFESMQTPAQMLDDTIEDLINDMSGLTAASKNLSGPAFEGNSPETWSQKDIEKTIEMSDRAKANGNDFFVPDEVIAAFREKLHQLQVMADETAESLDKLSGKNFMDVPDTDEVTDLTNSMNALKTATDTVVPSLQAIQNVMPTEAPADPFEGVVTGLQELAGVNLSDSLSNLEYVRSAVNKLGGEKASAAAANLNGISQALRGFNFEVPSGEGFANFASGLSQLGKKRIGDAVTYLPSIQSSLENLYKTVGGVPDLKGLTDLGSALSVFGRKTAQTAVETIPQLAIAFRNLIDTLANAPTVSQKVIDLANAMANLSGSARALNPTTNSLGKHIKGFTNNIKSARKPTLNLAAAFGKLYASYWLLIRLGKKAYESIDLASKLTEVQNIVNQTFVDEKQKMEDFAKSAVDTLGMSELTAKQIGSRFQAMGMNMSIKKSDIENTNEFVQAATAGYADVAHSMADMSINLTRLAGDMASFYNVDYADVAKDLESIFTGQTRPLRQYGLDLTQATLKEYALKNGLDADIKSMTQAEKMLLRYQYVLGQTGAAHGDFERTIGTWANQVRIASERVKQLQVILGKIGINVFKPLVTGFNVAMNQIIKLAEATLNSLGKIFGWQVEISEVGVLADNLDDVEDGFKDAGNAAKKFKAFLLGIDELNVLPDQNDKGAGGGAGGGGANITYQDPALNVDLKTYESIYDTLYKLGKRIGEVQKEFLEGIKWDEIIKKFQAFGKGFAQFLNGYFSDLDLFYQKGNFLAQIVNTIAATIESFFKELDGMQIGLDLGAMINGFIDNIDWKRINSAAYEMAHDIAQIINGAFSKIDWKKLGQTIAKGLNTAINFLYTLGSEINWKKIGKSISDAVNGFFRKFDFGNLAATVNKWAKGLLDLIAEAIGKVNWKQIGKKIGEFLSGIDLMSIAGKIAKVLWNVINAAFDMGASLFNSAPVETALLAVFLSPTLRANVISAVTSLFLAVRGSIVKDLASMGTTFAAAITTGLNSGSVMAGIQTFSASLSTAFKGVGSLLVGFLEFKAVSNTFGELVKGTDSLTEGIAKLAVEVGIAATAFTLLLGVPAGIIAAGAVAAVGAIVGITSAMKEVSENNVMTTLAADMGDAAISMDQLTENFKDAANEISGSLDKLHGQHDNVMSLKSSLEELASGYQVVVDAFSSGKSITAATVADLIGDIGNLKNTWADYISAKYDYQMQSIMADMQFAKSQGTLTDEMQTEYLQRIEDLRLAKDNQLSTLDEIASGSEEAWNRYQQAIKSNKSLEEIAEARKAWQDSVVDLTDLAETTGILESSMGDGEKAVNEFSDSIADLDDKISGVDFSNMDADSYKGFIDDMAGYNSQLVEDYDKAYSSIEQTIQDRLDMGDTVEQVTKDTQMYFDALDGEAGKALDRIQLSLTEKLYHFVREDDKKGAVDFYNNIMVPYSNMIKDEYGKATGGLEPWITDKAQDLLHSAYGAKVKDDGSVSVFGKVKNNWQGALSKSVEELQPIAEKAGYDMFAPISEGAEKSATDFKLPVKTISDEMDNLGNAFEGGSAKIDNANNAITRINPQFIAGGAAMETFQNEIKAIDPSSIDDVDTAMVNVNDTIGTVNESEQNLGSTFNDSTSKMLGNVDSLKDSFSQMVTEFTTKSSAMCEEIGTNISSWFTNSVAPWFTAEKWSGMWDEVKSGIQTKWNEFTDWWNNTGFKKWWDNSVAKWFTAEQWNKVSEGMKEGLSNKWNDFANWFSNTGFANWWNKVKDYFSAKNWTFDGIKQGLTAAWEAGIAGIKGVWNAFANWCNEHLKIEIPAVKNPLTGETLLDATTIGIKLPTFYMGGFPEDGLFMANHGELVGGFANGKTAVANNEQIVEGIKRGVYEAMSAVMSNNNNSTNLVVELDGRELFNSMVSENNRAINRTGTSPLWGV